MRHYIRFEVPVKIMIGIQLSVSVLKMTATSSKDPNMLSNESSDNAVTMLMKSRRAVIKEFLFNVTAGFVSFINNCLIEITILRNGSFGIILVK